MDGGKSRRTHIYTHTACAMVGGEGRGAEEGHEGGHVTRTVGTWLSVFIVSSSLVSDHGCGESAGEKSPRREEEGAVPRRQLSAHTLQSAHTPAGRHPDRQILWPRPADTLRAGSRLLERRAGCEDGKGRKEGEKGERGREEGKNGERE
jgi:hypothetical protein